MNFQIVFLISITLRIPARVYTSDNLHDIPPEYLSLRLPGESTDDHSSGSSSSSESGNKRRSAIRSNQFLVDTIGERVPYKYRGSQPFILRVNFEKQPALAMIENRIPPDNVQPWEGIGNLTILQAQTLCETIWSSYKLPVEGWESLKPCCYSKLHLRRNPNRYGGNLLVYRFLYSSQKTGTYDGDAVKCFCNYSKTNEKNDLVRPVINTKMYFYLMKFSSKEYALLTVQCNIRTLAIVDLKVV